MSRSSHHSLAFSSSSSSTLFNGINGSVDYVNGLSQVALPERQELELVEHNAARSQRDVILKWRPLRKYANKEGIRGMLLSLGGGTQTMGHWAIEVGQYTHELLVDTEEWHERHRIVVTRQMRHFRGSWPEDRLSANVQDAKNGIQRRICGSTNMTDLKIDEEGQSC